LFNGQGINASGEFDNTKDVVSRISLKPFPLSKNLTISGGTSLLYGGLQNNTAYYYTTQDESGIKKVMVDSSLNNIGSLSPRRYYGADLQLKLKKKVGFTEIRGEFLKGQQTGTAISSETPTALLNGNDGFYNRNFNGAYFYLVHNIFSENHQLVLKYDWYDPNTNVKKLEIGLPGSGFTASDIKYTTIGLGYQYLIGPNVKGVLYYAHVRNEKTLLPEFTQDVKDDVLTLRLQFRF
jgi:hypothetical protein